MVFRKLRQPSQPGLRIGGSQAAGGTVRPHGHADEILFSQHPASAQVPLGRIVPFSGRIPTGRPLSDGKLQFKLQLNSILAMDDGEPLLIFHVNCSTVSSKDKQLHFKKNNRFYFAIGY